MKHSNQIKGIIELEIENFIIVGDIIKKGRSPKTKGKL